jgi:hypothetical protein
VRSLPVQHPREGRLEDLSGSNSSGTEVSRFLCHSVNAGCRSDKNRRSPALDARLPPAVGVPLLSAGGAILHRLLRTIRQDSAFQGGQD